MKKQWIILSAGFIIILILGFALFLSRTASPQMAQNTPSVTPTAIEKNSLTDLGTFKGTRPCADCSGLETEIAFTKKDVNATAYQLNPGKPEESEYYLKVDDSHPKMLNKEQN